MIAPWKESYDEPCQHIKKYITLLTMSKLWFFPIVKYGCESWTIKKAEHWIIDIFKLWCWRRLLRVTWTARRSNSLTPLGVNPKGNQPWINPDAEAEAPILWSPDAKSWLIGKDPDAEKDWGQEEKGVTEDEMARWHHWPNGHEFKQTQGVIKTSQIWLVSHGSLKTKFRTISIQMSHLGWEGEIHNYSACFPFWLSFIIY